MNSLMRALLVVLGSSAALVTAPWRVEAHGLGAGCKINGTRVELEAYYDDDTPARAAKVRVQDAAMAIVAAGETDRAGRWSFALPPPGKYRIVADAGAGHRKTLDLVIPSATDPAASAEDAISAERKHFTRIYWRQLVIGLAIIAGVGLIAWLLLHPRKQSPQA
jgi:hypothetical protein